MASVTAHALELIRLHALKALRIMDTPPDPAFDRIVDLAADLFAVPVAAISLLDDRRSWTKATVGIDPCSTPREHAFCHHALPLEPHAVLVIEDALLDPRFHDHPMVTGDPHFRFYMGALLTDSTGQNLGTLCVLDHEPRPTPTPHEIARLQSLAAIAMRDLERFQTERASSEQKRLLDMAETMSGVGHWRFDVVTGSVFWSDEVYRIHGLNRASFDPMVNDAIAFYHPDDQPGLKAQIARSIQTGEGYAFQLRLLRADGAMRDVTAKATCEVNPDGRVTAMFGVFQDVTDQVKALRDTERSKARYKVLTDTMSDVIVRIRLDGTSPYISPRIKDLLGYDPMEMAGNPSHYFVAEQDRPAMVAVYAAMSSGQEEATIRHRATHKDGHLIWVETRFRLVRDDAGKPVDMVAVIRDISVQKALEDDLTVAREAAEAAAAVKSEFLANMSHELRTPLTSIIGFTGLASAQPDLPPMARNFIDRVENASRALLCTVNDILDFSKLEAGQVAIRVEPSDVSALCRATLDLFTPQAGSKDVALTLDIAPSAEGSFQVDPDRVRQILLNLVGNGVKFTDKGSVTLSVHHDPVGDHLSVSVRDTGDGIAEDKAQRLFQRFSQIDGSMTRNHGGTGLGLAICKGLVEAMGGEIGVYSTPGQGSRFWFTIPAPRVATITETTAPTSDQISFGGVRVLVADDHPSNRELARLFLSGVGAEITEVVDGEAACASAAEWPFDVILMDLRMPRLNGLEALRTIRSRRGPNDATPILAFTADASPDENVRLLATGFDGVVAKPVDAADLITAVARATDFAAHLPGGQRDVS